MSGLKVLITNVTLATRTGTELYVRDLALALRRLGHAPAVYSREPGGLMDELRAVGIPCATEIASLESEPDVIHGHHNYPTLAALLRFPGAPAVLFCHDARAWHDDPLLHPRIYHYVGVSEATADRLRNSGVDPRRIRIVPNFCDLTRFPPRPPLPDRPRRALAFSNYICGAELEAMREACGRAGLALDVAGAASGQPCRKPETILGNYDLVLAKGRAALEAMAVGCAVVLCDVEGAGPMVTPENFDSLRRRNFGMFTFQGPVTADAVARELARYDAATAAVVATRVRSECGADSTAQVLLGLYAEVMAEHRAAPARPAAEQQAAAPGVAWLTGSFRWALYHMEEARRATARTEAERDAAQRELLAERNALAHSLAEGVRLEAELLAGGIRLGAERDAAQRELLSMRATMSWRVRNRIVNIPVLGRAAERLSQLCSRFRGRT